MRLFLIAALVVGCKSESKQAAMQHDKPPEAPNANDKAVSILKGALESRYSHTGRIDIDWDKEFSKREKELSAAKTSAEFANVVAQILSVAKDTHILVVVDGLAQPIPTYRAPLEFNFDLERVQKVVKELKDLDPCLAVGKIDDKTSYLMLKSFVRGRCPQYVGAFNAAWEEISKTPQMIIDHRPNTGGDETLARVVAARFVEKDTDYAMTELGPKRKANKKFPRRLMAAPETQRYKGELRVLIGGGNLSSAEAFIMMMNHAVRTKTVGAKSFGSSGNPKGVVLGNGVTVNLPSWRAYSMDGKALEGVGIEPDIAVKWTTEGDGDVVIDAAMKSF